MKVVEFAVAAFPVVEKNYLTFSGTLKKVHFVILEPHFWSALFHQTIF